MASTLKIEKKIIEFFAMEKVFQELQKVPGLKFQIILSRNLKKLGDELDVIRKKSEASDEFKKLISDEDAVKREYAKKDKDGKPKVITKEDNGETRHSYDVDEKDFKKLDKAITEFWEKEENKKTFDEHKTKLEEYRKYITEESISLELVKFPAECINDNFFLESENLRLSNSFAFIAEELVAL